MKVSNITIITLSFIDNLGIIIVVTRSSTSAMVSIAFFVHQLTVLAQLWSIYSS